MVCLSSEGSAGLMESGTEGHSCGGERRKAGPWIHRFGVASLARVLPLVKSSAGLFTVSTYRQVCEAVRSWISETLVPTKTLYLQDSDVNQVRTVVESVQRYVSVMLRVSSRWMREDS